MTVSGPITANDVDFSTHPVHTTAVRAGISSSPFPSPGFTPLPSTTPQPTSLGSIGGSNRGAFTPYQKQSRETGREGGGGGGGRSGTGWSSGSPAGGGNPTRAVAEIPDLVVRGAHRSTTPTSRPSPQDNIMKFWQAGVLRSNSQRCQRDEDLEGSSTVEPRHEIEVCTTMTFNAFSTVCVCYV